MTQLEDLKFNKFTEYEIESLRLFHEQIEKVNDCKIIKNNLLGIKVSLESTEGGLISDIDCPSDDDLALLLLRIRPFTLQRDRVFFGKILDILEGKAANEETLPYIRTLHKNYNRWAAGSSTLVLQDANGKEYSELDIFKAFLYGDFFHIKNDEPREILRKFKNMPYATRSALISVLINYRFWFSLVDRVITYIKPWDLATSSTEQGGAIN